MDNTRFNKKMICVNDVRFNLYDVASYEEVLTEYDEVSVIVTFVYNNATCCKEFCFDNPEDAFELLKYLDSYFRVEPTF